jgi:hypothetical protein
MMMNLILKKNIIQIENFRYNFEKNAQYTYY